jgi:6-phosphogluconolactonase (cycloisomerase 2 family)
MLSACGTASNVQLDPSGAYLFVTDSASQMVRVARINLSSKTLTDTGNFFPITAQIPGFAFSPDGTIVYAWLASDSNLHMYGFDSSTGRLTEGGTSIPMSNSAGFVPALRR